MKTLVQHLKIKPKGAYFPSILCAIAAFGCYTCMYAFRKAFAGATFSNQEVFGLDYKICLVVAQMLGYTASKFYGVKYISETGNKKRGKRITLLIGASWLALLGFAITPKPYSLIFMLANGFPLGMIWGLVFSYLEGRKTTEFMGAVLSTTLIFASGFIKTVARLLTTVTNISESRMPFCVGALFLLPLLGFVALLEMMPPPSHADKKLRTKRVAMNKAERQTFLNHFFPGIVATVIIYVIFTLLRDIRDNFEVEIWHGLGSTDNSIFTKIDTAISLVVIFPLGMLILVKDNLKAFTLIHVMILAGCLLVLGALFLYQANYIQPVIWMTLTGIGLFMAYLPYNAFFFERLIATFHYKSNIGFLIYIADAFGYLASISILGFKEFGQLSISWLEFFKAVLLLGASIGAILTAYSLFYFRQKATKKDKTKALNNITNQILINNEK